jgi:hypothetical protein
VDEPGQELELSGHETQRDGGETVDGGLPDLVELSLPSHPSAVNDTDLVLPEGLLGGGSRSCSLEQTSTEKSLGSIVYDCCVVYISPIRLGNVKQSEYIELGF